MAKAEDTCSEIWVSKLSDCQLLTREHVQCEQIDELTVRLDAPLLSSINGAARSDTLDECQKTIRHLLLTYQPEDMYISFGDLKPEIQSMFTVDLPFGRSKAGLLTAKQQLLSKFTLEETTECFGGDVYPMRDDNFIFDILRLGYVTLLADNKMVIGR